MDKEGNGPGPHRPEVPIPQGRAELQCRFQKAAEERVRRACRECKYTPEGYIEAFKEDGGLEGVKRLLAAAVSDDSLQLWARGRWELTAEALAHGAEWQELFTAQEKAVASRRCVEWASGPSVDEVAAGLLPGANPPPDSEDNVFWGE